jgi:hypothetical protein
MMLRARKVQVTARNGIMIFHMISSVMMNGANTVRKQRTQVGSNELMLAMLPVPKNETTM